VTGTSSNLFDLTGHVALVTGGNGGIGLGLAHGLAGAGADVAIWGTSQEKTDRAVEELAAHGTRVAGLVCDIADEDAVTAAFDATVERLGHVDSCFANAGTGSAPTKFVDLDLREWRRVAGVNLDGTFLTLRAAARHMVERGQGGSLVATTSLTVVEGAPRAEAYAASKAGVAGMVRSLAVELARHGIRVNALMPGWIETDLNRAMLSDEKTAAALLPRVPARRWGAPSDLAAAAVYLAGPGSAYHTGDTLTIDGGYRLF
jgi:NAD(P)-dependent dehydrogenase (short-subunit alcohol dehydrogenase family)